MVQSIFSEDEDEEKDISSSFGGLSPSSSRSSVGHAPLKEESKNETDSEQSEIAALTKQIEVKKKEEEEAIRRTEELKSQSVERLKRKELFLKSYGEVFSGTTPSLGNFERELTFFEEQTKEYEMKATSAHNEAEALAEKQQEKKDLLEKKREELEKKAKMTEMQSAAGNDEEKESDQEKERVAKPINEDAVSGKFSESMGAYWKTLSWEGKKRVFFLRDALVSAMDRDSFLWEKLRDFSVRECAGEDANFSDSLKKAETANDPKKNVLLITICAGRAGKLDALEHLLQEA